MQSETGLRARRGADDVTGVSKMDSAASIAALKPGAPPTRRHLPRPKSNFVDAGMSVVRDFLRPWPFDSCSMRAEHHHVGLPGEGVPLKGPDVLNHRAMINTSAKPHVKIRSDGLDPRCHAWTPLAIRHTVSRFGSASPRTASRFTLSPGKPRQAEDEWRSARSKAEAYTCALACLLLPIAMTFEM